VKAVLHLGDGPHHAILGGPRVGGSLQRPLVRAQPRLLVDPRTRVPEQNLRGDVAADWLAAGVEQGVPSSRGDRSLDWANIVAKVSRSPGLAVILNSKACPGQMSPGLLAPTGVLVEPTWTMPG
jgi:hypothetical protein